MTQENSQSRQYPDRPLLGVGAVVFQGGKVLLIERGKDPLKGWWTLPGGLVETGECLECAVRREILEETGLEVRPSEVVAVFERIMPDIEGRTEFHYVIVDYLCEFKSGYLRPASDVSDARWVPVDKLDSVKMAPGTPPVIERARQLAAAQRLLNSALPGLEQARALAAAASRA